MKVLYDISTLGRGRHYLQDRTGIHRVVENIAHGLATSPECEVSFCATESWEALAGSFSYLETHDQFRRQKFFSPKRARLKATVERRLDNLKHELSTGLSLAERVNQRGLLSVFGEDFKLRRRLRRKLLTYANALLRNDFKGLEPAWLSGIDIFHAPVYPLPAVARRVQRFSTIYDVIPILYPHLCSAYQIEFMNSVVNSISRDDWVISISSATRDDLCSIVPIDPARVSVIHLSASPDLFYPCRDQNQIEMVRKKYGIPDGPYLLSVNTVEPRKNIDHIIRCFGRLTHEQRIKDLSLVLVGLEDRGMNNVLEMISRHDEVKDRIIMTGYVADNDLASLYSGALAFAYVSLYEGFGLPPLEAMQCGIPVITSNTSSLPEVVGDAGIMLDPQDADALCEAMLSVYRSQPLRESMSQKSLERAAQFSWGKCIKETISAYRTALVA